MRVRRGQDRVPVGVEGRLVAVIAAASGGKRQNHLIRCGMLFEHVCFGTLYTHTHTPFFTFRSEEKKGLSQDETS